MLSQVWEEESGTADEEAGTCWCPVTLIQPAWSGSPLPWALVGRLGFIFREAHRLCVWMLGHQLLGCPWGLAVALCSRL